MNASRQKSDDKTPLSATSRKRKSRALKKLNGGSRIEFDIDAQRLEKLKVLQIDYGQGAPISKKAVLCWLIDEAYTQYSLNNPVEMPSADP